MSLDHWCLPSCSRDAVGLHSALGWSSSLPLQSPCGIRWRRRQRDRACYRAKKFHFARKLLAQRHPVILHLSVDLPLSVLTIRRICFIGRGGSKMLHASRCPPSFKVQCLLARNSEYLLTSSLRHALSTSPLMCGRLIFSDDLTVRAAGWTEKSQNPRSVFCSLHPNSHQETSESVQGCRG